MDASPTSRLLIYGALSCLLLAMAFGFFALTGGKIRPGGNFGVSMVDVMYDLPAPATGQATAGGASATAPAAGSSRRTPLPAPDWSGNREPGVPETPAEEAYYSAIQKVKDQEERAAARLKPRDDVLRFLETPLGKDFLAVSELARRGRTQEARDAIKRVLEAMGTFSGADGAGAGSAGAGIDPRVRAYALKLAIQIYRQEKDTAGVADATRQYLELVKKHPGSDRELSGAERDRAGDARAQLEALSSELEQSGKAGH